MLNLRSCGENTVKANFIALLKFSFVASLSLGLGWESAGQTKTLNLAPDIIKTYTANQLAHAVPNGDLFYE